jgi:hypothetical protein
MTGCLHRATVKQEEQYAEKVTSRKQCSAMHHSEERKATPQLMKPGDVTH